MDRFLLRLLQQEAELQCQFILLALEQLQKQEGRNMIHGKHFQRSVRETWMSLQTIAVSAANLSKLFWGSAGSKENERKPLRESLGVTDDSPLRSPRLRNDFEHFDERIEKRFGTARERGYIGRNIGPTEGIKVMLDGKPEEPDTRYGQYEPDTGTLSFWANSINVFEIAAEVRHILAAYKIEAAKPFKAK